MKKQAFSLIELSIVVLIIGVVTIVALNGRSLLVRAECVSTSLGSKTITDNIDSPTQLAKNRSTAYENCVSRKLSGNICNTWQANTSPTAFTSSSYLTQPSNAFNTSKVLTGDPYPNSWMTQDSLGVVHRLYLDIGKEVEIGGIRVVNFHDYTSFLGNGIKDAKIYVVKSDPGISNGANVSDSDKVFDGIIPQNTNANSGANYSVLSLSKSVTGRYLVIDTYSAWLSPPSYNRIGVRRVEYCIW